MAAQELHLRLPAELLAHIERVQDEFALSSKTEALRYIVKRDMKAHPSKGRD